MRRFPGLGDWTRNKEAAKLILKDRLGRSNKKRNTIWKKKYLQ